MPCVNMHLFLFSALTLLQHTKNCYDYVIITASFLQFSKLFYLC